MTAYLWSQIAANNSNADSTVNWTEGQLAPTVNNSFRAMMAAIAKWRDDNCGASLITTGSTIAFNVTTNQGFTSTAKMHGASLCIRFNQGNIGAATLNVDNLGARQIVKNGAYIQTGDLVANVPHRMVYDDTVPAWGLIQHS